MRHGFRPLPDLPSHYLRVMSDFVRFHNKAEDPAAVTSFTSITGLLEMAA